NELALIGIPKCRCGFEPRRHYQNAYLQEIDGGNTPLLLQEIQETWPQEAWDLRNDLMALAPYVSEEALLEAAFSDVLPDAMLFEVCMANPDATKSEEFLRILHEDIPNPLPIYMINLIRENWDLETARTILERDMAAASSKMDYNMNMLLTNEKLKAEIDVHQIRNYHSQRDNLSDRFSIADSYIEEAKFDSSVMVLDNIILDFDLDDTELNEYDNFYLYHDLLQSLNDSNLTIFDLDTVEIALLENIANDNAGPSAIKSRNILCFAYNMCEEYPGNPSDTSQHKSVSVSGSPQKIINEAYTTLEVSPNPATNYAEFSWEILNIKSKAVLEIFDVSGKLTASHNISSVKGKWAWDTRDIIPGIYLYSLRVKDTQFTKGKISVID
ncbi:MAG: T9SS type A sorting domain-containing protein, partial [Bacteroidota bacterium]|nr:T9SS type A sorting domain-containing protein [Bacteroidota bacterium]